MSLKIQSTDTVHTNKLKIVLYGASGSGKTTSIKTLPHEKTLVVSAESGLLSLSGTKIDYVDIATDDEGKMLPSGKRIERLNDIVKYLCTKEAMEKYENIVVDSLTEIGEVIAAYWKEKITDKAKTFELWGNIGQSQTSFIKTMRDMPYYNVIFLCLEDLDKDEQSRRFYGPDLPGTSAKNFLIPAFDEVFRIVVEADGRRHIQTQPLATVKAKDRSGKLAPQEPVDLGLILNKISKVEKKEEKK
jgi:phage nucleotide-binding protein